MTPIQTRYKGYNFRSRLEARWAVFFDALGLAWEYEPEGFQLEAGWYLPDFRVTYPGRGEAEVHHQWFEVKGDLRKVSHNEWARMIEFEDLCGFEKNCGSDIAGVPGLFIVLDGPPALRMYLTPRDICSVFDKTSAERSIPVPYRVQGHSSLGEDGWALWSPKGRLWWDHGPDFFRDGSYFGCGDNVLEDAVDAARSARFEHGECGAT